MIEKAFENLDPKAEKRIKELTDEVERLALLRVSDSEIVFTRQHYEVVQKWFSETMLKKTDKCLSEWLEVRRQYSR